MGESNSRQRGEGRITRKKGSSKLYVDFWYLDRRIEKSTGYKDTEENRIKTGQWLDRRMEEIRKGTFRFEQAFPGASAKEKQYFANLEGRDYKPEPEQVLFGDYLETWIQTELSKLPHTTRIDYLSSINPWIRPFFKNLTFYQINSSVMTSFSGIFVKPQTDAEKAAGVPPKRFSGKRIKNVRSHFRNIWETACNCYRWNLPSPFPPPEKRSADKRGQGQLAKEIKVIKLTEKELRPADENQITPERLPLRFDDWLAIKANLGAWYQPIAELMLLTGMIPSEIAGLCGELVTEEYILIRQVISRGRLYKYPKADARIRDIRITARIRTLLDTLASRTTGSPFLVTTRTGGPMSHKSFGKAWDRAVKSSGVSHRVPYCLRHLLRRACFGTTSRLLWHWRFFKKRRVQRDLTPLLNPP